MSCRMPGLAALIGTSPLSLSYGQRYRFRASRPNKPCPCGQEVKAGFGHFSPALARQHAVEVAAHVVEIKNVGSRVIKLAGSDFGANRALLLGHIDPKSSRARS